jgi:hypothetical protein
VLVRPSRIRLRFAYEPPRTVRVVPPPGAGSATSLRFGELRSRRDRTRRDTAAIQLRLAPNDAAEQKGGTFYARLEADPANPSVLPPSALLVNGKTVEVDTITLPAARALTITVTARSPQVKAGTYRGTLRLADGSAEVEGPHQIPWEVTVKKVPRSPWIWLLVAAAVAGAAAVYRARTRPMLQGRLIVEAPARDFREIVLSGEEIFLDEEARPTASDPALLRIVPEGSRGDSRPRVYKVVGEAYIRRAGEDSDQGFNNEVLRDGDELRWGEYRLSYHRS